MVRSYQVIPSDDKESLGGTVMNSLYLTESVYYTPCHLDEDQLKGVASWRLALGIT